MMNRSPLLLLLALSGCGEEHSLIAAANAAVPSSAAATVSASSASPSGASPASASPSASAATPPAPPTPKKLFDNPPPAEKSKAPSATEWLKAEQVLPFRDTDHNCKMKQIREWVQVFCAHSPFGVSLVTGNREGLTFRDVSESEPSGTYLTFPVRRGDRRVFLLFSQTKWAGSPSTHVSVQWLEGDAGPIVGFY